MRSDSTGTQLTEAEFRLLARVPLFAGVKGDALNGLLAGAHVRHHPRNALLFVQDDPADAFFVVLDGWVKLFRMGEDGTETVIHVFTAGESFAEAAIFEARVFPVSATVAEDARLLVFPAAAFIRHLRDNADLALNILGAMSRHLRFLVAQVEQRGAMSSTERLAAFLLRLCLSREGTEIVHLPMDKSLIAARLAMQPETLSRCFARLRKKGIKTKGSEVTIPDVAALRSFSEGN